jgi:D-threonine aldolase
MDWFAVTNVAEIPSPALLVYPERVRANIRRAIRIVVDPARLRPHVKTHKTSEVIRMHLEEGVTKFKCATIAEAEMTASAGAADVLVASQLVGPNVKRLAELRGLFPNTRFAAICDNVETAEGLNAVHRGLPVYVDVNCGMGRTGSAVDCAAKVYRAIERLPNLEPAGLHAYDGHIHDLDLLKRTEECRNSFEPVLKLRDELGAANLIASGTPTFAIHARYTDRECSPGTYVYWDFGYAKFADLPFEVAALVLARVLSKPAKNRLCLDLGHKSVAAENPPPRVQFLNLPEATPVMHSEEHLVIETPEADRWKVGEVLYGVPRHICPTVALHDECYPVGNNQAGPIWRIEARRRRITV